MSVLRYIGRAVVVQGCYLVWLGTKLGGYNLKVATPAGFVGHGTQAVSIVLATLLLMLAADMTADAVRILKHLLHV